MLAAFLGEQRRVGVELVNQIVAEMREELSRRARIAAHQAAPFAGLGHFSGRYTGGLFWRFTFAPGVDVIRLYQAAKERNVLVSPGWVFRCGAEAGAPEDGWMRVNVSCCEGNTLSRVLELLRVTATR